ncbi:MAG: FtsQ-type POTRA domain-containing protein [Chloroflexi bacterium]|nr:FtsQ-type POTRA domain-containing protein [Chloroflexota bacterium]
MFSVDRKRRARLQAKRAAREGSSLNTEAPPTPKDKDVAPPDGHVKAAVGRRARLHRRLARRRMRQNTPASKERSANWFLIWQPGADGARRLPLRRRRKERRLERERREGLSRPEDRVRPRGVVWVSWRWLSGTISASLAIILYIMLSPQTELFAVKTIAVGGERYLTAEQVFEATEIARQNLFQLDSRAIEAKLESNPSIADAQVFIGWPPNMVSIYITERDPAITWQQGEFRYWVDVNGIVMFQRQEREDLLRIVYQGPAQEPLGVGSRIDRSVITGALQLKAKLPRIKVMLYDPIKGLGFREEGNWIAWFGTGTNMEQKLLVYDAIVRNNFPTIQFEEVNVSDPDHPTFVNRFPDQ